MNSAISIRDGRPEESHDIAALAAKSFTHEFGHLYSPHDLQTHLDRYCSVHYITSIFRTGRVLVAANETQILGFLTYGSVVLPIHHDDNDIELHKLYIDPDHQGQGIGRALIHRFMEDTASVPSRFLGVWENNMRAQKLYESLGFEYVGEHHFMVGDHADRDLIMKRSA